MVKEVNPIDAIKDGPEKQRRYYLRKALWSEKGPWAQKAEVRDGDLTFWFGGIMPMATRVRCESLEQAKEVVERYKDGLLPEEGWQEGGICLEGMTLRVTDKDGKILADITIGEDEIAAGKTRDGILLVCDGELFEHLALDGEQAEVMLGGISEEATWAWTMHTCGQLDLSALEIHYRNFPDHFGHRRSLIVTYGYGKRDGEEESHRWGYPHLSRFDISMKSGLLELQRQGVDHNVEVRIALDESGTAAQLRAWRGNESFSVGEIVRNREEYPKQFDLFCDALEAWHWHERTEDIGEAWGGCWEVNFGIYDNSLRISFQDELKARGVCVHDYRSQEARNFEEEYRKIRACADDPEDVLSAAGWKRGDGEDAAIQIMASHCGISEEVARCSYEEGVWEMTKNY